MLQRLADVLGRPVHRCAEPEASLRGAAVYAAEQEKMDTTWSEEDDLSKGEAVRPRRRVAALYARERQRQEALEQAMSAVVPAQVEDSI